MSAPSVAAIISETVDRITTKSTPDEVLTAVTAAAAAFAEAGDIARKIAENAVIASLKRNRVDGAGDIARIAFAKQGDTAANEAKADKSMLPALLQIAENEGTYWKSPSREAYATIALNDHKENWPVMAEQFADWLTHRAYTTYKEAPSRSLIDQTVNVLRCKARFEGPQIEPRVRTAWGSDGCIYLDLGTPDWSAVRVSGDGWGVVSEAPVKFHRNDYMKPLPTPSHEGTIDLLREFVNVAHADDFKLIVGWLMGALRPSGPYPILGIHGEQGAAKSTLTRILRELTDPVVAPKRTLPKDERDLMISAQNALVLSFDNVSKMSDQMSDAFCRLSTGGGLSGRKLYTDSTEHVLDAMRPMMFNGIEELAARDDMRNRSIIISLPDISSEKRRTEAAFYGAFEAAKPDIFGALLDGLSAALRNLPSISLPYTPRMADFAEWVTAAEAGFGWESQSFLEAYEANLLAAIRVSLEANPVAQAIQQFVIAEGGRPWTGTATLLIERLSATRAWAGFRNKPPSPVGLSGQLRRLAPSLREVGIGVAFSKSTDAAHARLITVERSV